MRPCLAAVLLLSSRAFGLEYADWARRGVNGYCAKTEASTLPGCSRTEDKGTFALDVHRLSLPHAAHQCLAQCARCERCRFVSVSAHYRDCSWFAACDLSQASVDVAGFVSGPRVHLQELWKEVVTDVSPLRLMYGAASLNDDRHPGTWIASAQSLPGQLEQLAEWGEKTPIRAVRLTTKEFAEQQGFDFSAASGLHKAFARYASDKARNGYWRVYASILKALGGKKSSLRLLEVGMGTNVSSAVSSMSFYGAGYRPGASLRAWRDALPNSHIFGADIDESILFNNEERIRTARADQLDPGSLLAVYELYGAAPFDLLIDDGLHSSGANLNTLLFGLRSAVRRGGWVVIEDLRRNDDKQTIIELADRLLRAPGARKVETWLLTCSEDTKGMFHTSGPCMYVVHVL